MAFALYYCSITFITSGGISGSLAGPMEVTRPLKVRCSF